MELVWIGRTSDPIYGSILLAANINRRLGGAVVTPWDVDELPDEYLDAFNEWAAAENRKASKG